LMPCSAPIVTLGSIVQAAQCRHHRNLCGMKITRWNYLFMLTSYEKALHSRLAFIKIIIATLDSKSVETLRPEMSRQGVSSLCLQLPLSYT
jgi:hypothetical protein